METNSLKVHFKIHNKVSLGEWTPRNPYPHLMHPIRLYQILQNWMRPLIYNDSKGYVILNATSVIKYKPQSFWEVFQFCHFIFKEEKDGSQAVRISKPRDQYINTLSSFFVTWDEHLNIRSQESRDHYTSRKYKQARLAHEARRKERKRKVCISCHTRPLPPKPPPDTDT
jgi:hypothetical protein